MATSTPPFDFLHALDRYRFLTILKAADECEEYQFAKQAEMLWLVNYSGDLFVQYHQALTYFRLGKKTRAVELLEGLLELDPTFIEPLWTLIDIKSPSNQRAQYQVLLRYLTHKSKPGNLSENWLSYLWDSREAFDRKDYPQATDLIHKSLVENPPSPLPAILHLKIINKMDSQEILNNLCEIYYQQWPKCLQINVIKAISEMAQGKESEAVERLHWVAAQDNAGQVIQQLMGTNHRFLKLWQEKFEIYFDLPIPAAISAHLGWNQLQSGQIEKPEFKQASEPVPNFGAESNDVTQELRISIAKEINGDKDVNLEPDPIIATEPVDYANQADFEEIQKVFAKLAKRLKKPDLERSDNRFPLYVILSSRKQLESNYGPNTTGVIDEELERLTSLIQTLPDWGALRFYPDDAKQMAELGLKPCLASDAWQVKLSLADLDKALVKKGEMIGAVLIVGGPEIIPFHHLPNPTFDNDLDVPSDNPYATIDDNYFIPQWPVGRLPGETGSDAGLLLTQIRALIFRYEKRSKYAKPGLFNLSSVGDWFRQLFSGINSKQKKSLGYTAEIWRKASADVYKTVGKVNELQLSPPFHSESLPLNNHLGYRLGYFNLHGIKDGPYWYGQKDFSSESSGPDYPIALSPNMFNENSRSPNLIVSEACYGANIHQKRYQDALSLKCLDSGTSSFVGSTCVAYGSVMPPLIAADFLAESFWRQAVQGYPVGYALMEAKLKLAEEMVRVQGFLDGEDQKTILSFVLFGDPLAAYDGIQKMPKPLFRIKSHPAPKTISDSDMEPASDETKLPKNVNREVKKAVEKYLPGLQNAQMHINKSPSESGDHLNESSTVTKTADSERYVVTLKKSYEQDQLAPHHHYARLTFDKKGKLVKFATSR